MAITTGQLGAAVGTSALVAEWADGTVKRVELSSDGSSYTGTTHPFLTGITNPVPVLMTPTGTLLVGDWTTGTIYQISAAAT